VAFKRPGYSAHLVRVESRAEGALAGTALSSLGRMHAGITFSFPIDGRAMDNASMKTTLSRRRVIALLAGATGGLVAARTRAATPPNETGLSHEGLLRRASRLPTALDHGSTP